MRHTLPLAVVAALLPLLLAGCCCGDFADGARAGWNESKGEVFDRMRTRLQACEPTDNHAAVEAMLDEATSPDALPRASVVEVGDLQAVFDGAIADCAIDDNELKLLRTRHEAMLRN